VNDTKSRRRNDFRVDLNFGDFGETVFRDQLARLMVRWLVGCGVTAGYLLAGSLVGPGGFGLINELVQVETLAQFGVVFLLFCLGAEFSVAKLRHVGGVAVLGGLLQVCAVVVGLSAPLATLDPPQRLARVVYVSDVAPALDAVSRLRPCCTCWYK
jgi:hypothetical protein